MENGAFKDAYVRLVTRAWSDDAYRQTILDDPAATLRDAGFEFPENAQVRVDTDDYASHEGTGLDAAADVWNRGHQDGIFRIAVPASAPVELAELDEQELAGLAGGVCCSCCCA